MRRVLGALVVLAILAGCGPAASVDKLSSDLSGKDPVLQVWCHAKRLEEGSDIKVVVEWNKNVGTGPVAWNQPRERDNICVVNIQQWSIGNSSYERLNEMTVRFLYNDQELAHRVCPAPTEFVNAFNDRK